MIHTAEDILEIIFEPTGMPFQTTREDLQMAITLNPSLELIEKAINEARIEAIKVCAEVAFKEVSHESSECVVENEILKILDQIK